MKEKEHELEHGKCGFFLPCTVEGCIIKVTYGGFKVDCVIPTVFLGPLVSS